MKRLVPALATVLLLAGCGDSQPKAASSSPTPGVFKVQGVISVDAGNTVPSQTEYSDGGDCVLAGGYEDIQTGAQVTVKDQDGTVIGLGALDVGHIQNGKCQFGFEVPGVPEGRNFYSIEVSHRGALQYTRATLDQPLALTLG